MGALDGGRRRFVRGGLAAAVGAGLVGCGSTDAGRRGPRRPGPAEARTFSYGRDDNQVADLYLPGERAAPTPRGRPVVVLVHGGFWLDQYGRELMVELATDVVRRGWTAWNIEYRRVGQRGGGWPGTFADVAAGVDHLGRLDGPTKAQLDTERVAVVGHSAGGQLAAWAAARGGLARTAPGAEPSLRPMAVVSLAGVLDLVGAAEEGVGGTAVEDLMGGGPTEVPERYQVGSPLARVPIGVPVRCVHGRSDVNVPISQSERYVAAATRAGDQATVASFDGDHFDVLRPGHESWTGAAAWLAERFAS